MSNYIELDAERNNILIVDDDFFVCEMVSEHLRSKGYRTFIATSISEAKQFLADSIVDFNLIILDYQLGSESGMDLLTNSKLSIDLSRTPIIMLSSNDDPAILEESFFHGVSDYVIKPVNLTLLTSKIRIIIDSAALKNLVIEQNKTLSRYKASAEVEESVAKFTYEYLVKKHFEPFHGVNSHILPCAAFSGDILLVKNSPSGDVYILLADATGHGLAAAITIMPVVAAFNTMVAKGFHLERIVTEINKKLISDTPDDRFVAAVFIQIKKEQGEMTVWNGAMPAVYVIKNGEVAARLTSQHMALGILNDNLFDSATVTLAMSGDENIFIFSDGLFEQKNNQNNVLPMNEIIKVMTDEPATALIGLIDRLKEHAKSEVFSDDVSLCHINMIELLSYCPVELKINSKNLESSEFTWSLRLCGKSLAQCEPSQMANQFLQAMDVNQPLCQRVFLVLTEMLSNALEHGILKLDSKIKNRDDGFIYYYEQRKSRLSMVTEKDWIDIAVSHKFVEGRSQINLQVTDSGYGYMEQSYSGQDSELYSGRGLNLIHSLSKELKILPPGNFIQALIQ